MDRSRVVIRPPLERDARGLAEVHAAAWRAAYRGAMTDEYLDGMDVERMTEGWRRGITAPTQGTAPLLAEVSGEVAGFVIVGPPDADAEPGTGQLYALNVHPTWWAQGIGSALLAAAEQKLHDLGYERAFLLVEKNNHRAIGFYTGRGWKPDGGTLEDTRFNPPVMESRHSRTFL